MKKLLQKYTWLPIILLLLFCIPVLFPLFHTGFFVTDDGEWMIIRFSAFYQALADGQFPVRFLHRLNFDFGYPVATFLYPGFLYAGIPFHLLKIGFVETIKLVLGLSLIATTVFTYLWLAKVFTKKSAAFVGALASLYLPYHLYDVYTRGSVGEVFALVWVPFTLWMIERKSLFWTSIGIALLLLSHNSLALLFLPILFIYAFLRKLFALRYLFICFVFGMLLASFFIIPAVFELSQTKFSQTIISDPTKYLASFSLIGHATLFIFLYTGILFFFRKKLDTIQKPIVFLFLFITLFVGLVSSSVSEVLWKFLPSSFIQFPFRLLSYLVISVAFLTAFFVSEIKGKIKKKIVMVGIGLLLLITSYPYSTPREFIDKGEGFYFTNEATTTVQNEYMPIWVKEEATQRAMQKVEVITGEAEISNIAYNNKQVTFSISVKEQSRVRINTLYWPGWKVFVNEKEVPISYNNPKGVIEFDVSKGEQQVRAEFGETQLRLIADLISLGSFIVLLIIAIRFKR